LGSSGSVLLGGGGAATGSLELGSTEQDDRWCGRLAARGSPKAWASWVSAGLLADLSGGAGAGWLLVPAAFGRLGDQLLADPVDVRCALQQVGAGDPEPVQEVLDSTGTLAGLAVRPPGSPDVP
jgi:hypothetical protein